MAKWELGQLQEQDRDYISLDGPGFNNKEVLVNKRLRVQSLLPNT